MCPGYTVMKYGFRWFSIKRLESKYTKYKKKSKSESFRHELTDGHNGENKEVFDAIDLFLELVYVLTVKNYLSINLYSHVFNSFFINFT